ncbi:MAG TPA: UvrD-helicase domain-containing protein [Opitutus sp.]|nr:UvrD-helicase domain-containing protein [Opitutus sp.]
MTRIGHMMILASAGSGKTYALTNRYVRLLAHGVEPARIVALTFTRKAAGEFFDEILNKLARAAREPAYARELAGEIKINVRPAPMSAAADAATPSDPLPGAPVASGECHVLRDTYPVPLEESVTYYVTLEAGVAGTGGGGGGEDGGESAFFRGLLRRVIEAMPRLQLGTLDGFFARIVSAFALELGLAGDFEVLEEHAARTARARVLRRMFERTGALSAAQREFVEAFKRATFGAEEKRLGEQLDAFLDQHQETFLEAPDGNAWGNPRAIWPEGAAWWTGAGEPKAAAGKLREWIETAEIADKQRGRWREFLTEWETWSPGGSLPRPLGYVLEKALAALAQLDAGTAVLEFDRKKQTLGPEACGALAALTRHAVASELTRRLEMTRGIHAVLTGYDAVYHETVRRAGRLTFGDVQRLLEPGGGARRLSTEMTDAARLAIDYRLDGEFSHWLLDEFQDTSFGQWSVLRNLIDEAVQDPTGARSFFYVGDVKQAIFAWRAGDPKLFREIFNAYNARAPGTITEEHLVRSWRSGRPVIDAVNAVFGSAGAVSALLPGAASAQWNKEWRKHDTAKPGLGGHVALLHATAEEKAGEEPARFAVTLALLREIDPLARGLSCAVLVQRNDTAAALADYLRHEGGLPATAESDLHVCTDNPLGAALLALAKVAAHPGDTLAWEHVWMTPLGGALAAEGLATPEDVTRRLLADFHADGFERTFAAWMRRLEPALAPDDAFSRERARQFAVAAARFDATGSRDVAEFGRFMERQTVRDVDTSAAIRVMTIHKAKGLGFDLVILPDLQGQRLDQRRDGLAVQRDAERAVQWVLDLPEKMFREADMALAAHVREAEADAGYEALSLLYVAMTRAKRAMYLVVNPPGDSSSRNYPRLLAATLGEAERAVRVGGREFAGAFAAGDPDWHASLRPAAPVAAPAEIAALAPDKVVRVPRRPARRPGAGREGEFELTSLFAPERAAATEFGTAVHALLAEAGPGADVATLEARWHARGAETAAVREALACLREPGLAAVWAEPARGDTWRERAFEVVLDGAWVSGICDRVVVERDVRGRATGATVFDFKTDRVEGEAEVTAAVARHAPQMNLYRRAVALLAGLPVAVVGCVVVFTRLRRTAAVPRELSRNT